MIQKKSFFDGIADKGYGKSFHFLTSGHLLQVTVFEATVDFDFFTEIQRSVSVLQMFPCFIGGKWNS